MNNVALNIWAAVSLKMKVRARIPVVSVCSWEVSCTAESAGSRKALSGVCV